MSWWMVVIFYSLTTGAPYLEQEPWFAFTAQRCEVAAFQYERILRAMDVPNDWSIGCVLANDIDEVRRLVNELEPKGDTV